MNEQAMASPLDIAATPVLSQPTKFQQQQTSQLRRTCSASNIIPHSDDVNNTSSSSTPLMKAIETSVLNAVLLKLPAMISTIVKDDFFPAANDGTADQKHNIPETLKTNQLNIEINRKKTTDTMNKINGLQKKLTLMSDNEKKIRANVLPDIEERIGKLEKSWTSKEKAINNKTKNLLSSQNRLEENLKEITEIKEKLLEQLNEADEKSKTLSDIDSSQKFVSAEYDVIKNEHESLKAEVKELSLKVKRQEGKNEQTANYTRLECVEFCGVPVVRDRAGNENCRWQIIEICKELNYWLPAHTISTAHRVKQNAMKKGPAPIIVKFNCKDVRNDVFRLRSLTRGKTDWRCFNMRKLYINESLTPDARKLFYQTRLFTQEMERIHGKIFSWTFKGEIFIRKDVDKAPKRKITSYADLTGIKQGSISIDAVPTPTPTTTELSPPSPPIATLKDRTDDVIKAMSNMNI